MRFTNKNLPKRRSHLDEFVRQQGLRPVGVTSWKGRDIFLAETDLEVDKPGDFPWGYYQVAWFVTSPKDMEKFDVGSWVEFDKNHDDKQGWTESERERARVREAIRMACQWINTSEEAGRYDA